MRQWRKLTQFVEKVSNGKENMTKKKSMQHFNTENMFKEM